MVTMFQEFYGSTIVFDINTTQFTDQNSLDVNQNNSKIKGKQVIGLQGSDDASMHKTWNPRQCQNDNNQTIQTSNDKQIDFLLNQYYLKQQHQHKQLN